MDKREVKRAFRAAMALEFAAVPATEDAVAYSFTQGFCRRMEALIAERKRGSWRLMRKRAQRVLIAAILAVLLALLVACSPNLRMVLKDFVVDYFGGNADYQADVELRASFDKWYWLGDAPEGYTLKSTEQFSAYTWLVEYQNADGEYLIFEQRCGGTTSYSADTAHSSVTVEIINGREVAVWATEKVYLLTWIEDGYQMEINCRRFIEEYPPELVMSYVQVMDTEVADG